MACLKNFNTNDDENCLNGNGLCYTTYFGSFTFIKDSKWRPNMFIKHLKHYVMSEFDESSIFNDEETKLLIKERRELFDRLCTFINSRDHRFKSINLAFAIIHFDFEDFLTGDQDFVLPESFLNYFSSSMHNFDFSNCFAFGKQLLENINTYCVSKSDDLNLYVGNARYIEMLLQMSGDIESNPGPVFSKPTFNRECTINVGTEGIQEWFKLPVFFSSLSDNFSRFVEKLPDRTELLDFGMKLFSKMEQISESIVESSTNFGHVIEHGFDVLKSMVTKSLVLLVFIVFKSAITADGILNTIGNFLFRYFDFSTILYKMRSLFFTNKVSTESCIDEFFNLDKTSYLPIVGASIFSMLFLAMFKKDACKGDIKSVFQDAFIMNRGIDSLEGLFDKAFNIWDMITNKLLQHRIGMDFPVTKFESSVKINKFMADLKNVFSQDFDLLDFDDKKAYRREVAALHKQSIDILVAVDSMERKRQAGVRQMITLLNQKYTQVISQPLTGKMRLPMYPLLLSGGSGVGKTRLLPILQAISAKVIERELGVPVSQDNVVALNMEADHADGYLGQFVVFCNDVFKKKNSEMNPNTELDFFMSAIDQAPYPLKMANLAEKGMFFTSLVGLISTNVVDIKQYADVSQSYSSAICTRLKNNYKVSILPWYRKYIAPRERTLLEQDQKFFQHSVDPARARYIIHHERFPQCGIRHIVHDNLLDTYTDEEFELMPKTLLKDLPENAINTQVYRFKKYRLDPFSEEGSWLTYTEFATQFAENFSRHIKSGSITLKEQTDFFNMNLDDMFEGTRVPTEGLTEQFTQWLWPRKENNCTDIDVFHDCENPEFTVEFEECMKIFLSAFAEYTCWRDFCRLDESARSALARGISLFGDVFSREAYIRAKQMMDERNNYFERETFLHGTMKQKFDALRFRFSQTKTFVLMKQIGMVLSGCVMVYGAHKLINTLVDRRVQHTNPNAFETKKIVQDGISKKSWLQWFVGLITGSNCHIKLTDIRDIELSYDDLVTLYDMYGIIVTPEMSSPGGKSQQRQRMLRLRVPTQVAIELHDKIKDVHIFQNGVEFPEDKIAAVMVHTEALMSQLTEIMVDHIIPANQWFLEINHHGLGNVTFLDADHILMPYHYVEHIRSMKNQKKMEDSSQVIFSRGPTLREQLQNVTVKREIITELRYLMDYVRIESGIPSNPTRTFAKDAIIVKLPRKYRSGTTCRDIKSKFIRRKEIAKLSAMQCQGHMFSWRKIENVLTDIRATLTDIKPVNVIKEYEALPLTEVQEHMFEDGTIGEISIVLTARYEYSINSRKGDCGSLLYVADPTIPNGLVGIHVSKAMEEGKSCSVPICYEDIMETLSARVETMSLVPTIEPTNDELYAPDRIAPGFPFEVVGKVVDSNYTTFQPTKTSWRFSALGEKLDDLLYKYQGQGKDYDIRRNMSTATLRPYLNTTQAKSEVDVAAYRVHNGKILHNGEHLRQDQWDEFKNTGIEFVSPMLKGLKKAERDIAFFNGTIVARIVDVLTQKLAKGGKSGYINLSNYLSSITNSEYDEYTDEIEYIDALVVRIRKFLASSEVESYYQSKAGHTIEDNQAKYAKYKILREIIKSEVEPSDKYGNLALKNIVYIGAMSRESFLAGYPAIVSMEFHHQFFSKKPKKKIFDIRTAVKGVDGNRACKSMNAKSSPGYGGFHNGQVPYMNRGFPFGKKCWFGEDYELDNTNVDITVNGKVVCTKEQVRENFKGLEKDVDFLLETAKVERPSVIFVASLKDEKRSIEKCKEGKTRVFFQCDMATCIATKMLCGPIWSWYILNNIENQLSIGINPYGIDWERIVEKVTRFGSKCLIAGDYAAFDQSQGLQNMLWVDDIDAGVALRGGITSPEQIQQMQNLQNGLSIKHILVNNILVKVDQMVESGGPKTCIKDCILNLINIYYCFCILFDDCGDLNDINIEEFNTAIGIRNDFEHYKETDEFKNLDTLTKKHLVIVNTETRPKISIIDVQDYMEVQVCGDDHIIAVAKEIQPWLNQRTLSGLMKFIGMDYTDETKTGKMPPDLRSIEEITFLKRKFKKFDKYGRKWIAPLDIDVVKEIPLWRTNNQSIEAPEALKDNMKTALREMALHGRKEYDEMKKFFLFSWNELYPSSEVIFDTYDRAIYEVLHSDSDLDF